MVILQYITEQVVNASNEFLVEVGMLQTDHLRF